jgi:hypothetical protein
MKLGTPLGPSKIITNKINVKMGIIINRFRWPIKWRHFCSTEYEYILIHRKKPVNNNKIRSLICSAPVPKNRFLQIMRAVSRWFERKNIQEIPT